jgi:hypothetical protein
MGGEERERKEEEEEDPSPVPSSIERGKRKDCYMAETL